jgi:glycosyltransferase involved in cell wall biosynthesis
MTIHDYRLICPSYLLINGNKELCHKCEGKKFHNAILYKCNNNSYLQSTLAAAESLFRNSITPYDKYIDHFIMVSNFSRKTHLKYLPSLKIKSSVLYNFYTGKNEVNNEKKTDNFIYIGRLSNEKGILRLINAFKTLGSLNLLIVGDGPLKELIKSEINQYSNIKFLGFKKDKELETLISTSKFTVVPSECYENNPMAIIESYYQGVPVIGSNIGGIPEVIKDNSTGYLFDFMDTDSLKKTLIKASNTDSKVYSLMNSNCKTFFKENFNNAYHYNKLIKLYQQVIDSKLLNS